MDTNYGQDPKNFSKCQQCLSYDSCDEMIKNSPCKVGLRIEENTYFSGQNE